MMSFGLMNLDLKIGMLQYVKYGDFVSPSHHNSIVDCIKEISKLLYCYNLYNILPKLRIVKTGDVILPDDHNNLVDAIKAIRDCIFKFKSTDKLDNIIQRLRYVDIGDEVLSSDHNDLVDAIKEIRALLPLLMDLTVVVKSCRDYHGVIHVDVKTSYDLTTETKSTNVWGIAHFQDIPMATKVNISIELEHYIPIHTHVIMNDNVTKVVYLREDYFTNLWETFMFDFKRTGCADFSYPDIISACGDGYLRSFDYSGSVRWSTYIGDATNVSPIVLYNSDIYIGNSEGYFYWIKPVDGSIAYYYNFGAPITTTASCSPDMMIYFGDKAGYLHSISLEGYINWSTEIGYEIVGSPAIGSDGTIYITTSDGKVYAVSPNGVIEWILPLKYNIYTSVALGSDDTIYVGCMDNNLYAINPDGSIKWKFHTYGKIEYSDPTVGQDGTVYVGDNVGNLYAISPDGQLKWVFQTYNSITTSPAISLDGIIYFATRSGRLYALNTDGSVVFELNLVGSIHTSPVVDSRGYIYIGTDKGFLYRIKPDGSIDWVVSDLVSVGRSLALAILLQI